jgi:pimeloyl-ACP methyl ester carboxylesterase
MPTFTRNGFSTYYEDSGSGYPVVLICGLSTDLQLWGCHVPDLSKTYRVITFDNRGAGRTDAPDEPYTIGQMANDLDALLGDLSIESASVVGWSMGGVIAQALARANPARVGRLLLLSTYVAPDGYLKAAISNWVNMRRAMPFELVARHVARMVYSPALANNPTAYEACIQAIVNDPYRQTDHGFFRQAEALLAYWVEGAPVPPGIPAAVMVGEDDQLTPPYLSELLAAAIPGATLDVLPGAHAGVIECPDQWSAAMARALARLR